MNIWTDSKYAFGVLHAHGAIWNERGLLSAQESEIKHKEEILKLLEAINDPSEVAVMHSKAHQLEKTAHSKGNQFPDISAKKDKMIQS